LSCSKENQKTFNDLQLRLLTCASTPNCALLATICRPYRDRATICVVADIRDVMAIESTGQYQGRYHVLGGIISPIDGVSPADLYIDTLIQRVASGEIKEIILALNATMEGETTCFYLFRKLSSFEVKISSIAYTDEVTLGRSILLRTPYEVSLKR